MRALLALLLLLTCSPAPAAVMTFDARWGDTAYLPVQFLEPAPPRLKAAILATMNEWSRHGAVYFYEVPRFGVIRITLDPAQGEWSEVGRDALTVPYGQPTMALGGILSLKAVAANRGGILHEAGHALGLEHEHQRPELERRINPTKAIRYDAYWYGWSANETYWYELKPLDLSRCWYTPPDPGSIMCYDVPGEITWSGVGFGGTATGISFWDGRLIGALYPMRGK